ncbi:hypothetical protein [Cytobacillus dafuensis]|uniref:Uncharacterized protein n=1 Tax=Cytobacillus dafuensis TaxID=1742359 RepID=A0A5B8Z327_CYTDA|nr:hypothetical protein [Cytobacillus dafuensis]QED47301.1 hypothetical protein FSZ17_08615 [Cytobacillus dafuensis]
MKRSVFMLLVFLLAITNQAFASPKNNVQTNDEKVEVAEITEVTDVNEVTVETELEQILKLDLEWSGELSNSLDEDNSSNADKLCWVCTKLIVSEDPKYYVCVDGYWSKYCIIK